MDENPTPPERSVKRSSVGLRHELKENPVDETGLGAPHPLRKLLLIQAPVAAVRESSADFSGDAEWNPSGLAAREGEPARVVGLGEKSLTSVDVRLVHCVLAF